MENSPFTLMSDSILFNVRSKIHGRQTTDVLVISFTQCLFHDVNDVVLAVLPGVGSLARVNMGLKGEDLRPGEETSE